MLTNHDSLLSRCFKAKYFPRCTFLEATDHPRSSYVWKNLIAAQPILRKGCCWRVGSGSSIRVLSDKWLSLHPSNKILTPPVEVEEDWLVLELIDWNTFQWDRSLIDRVFSKYDVEAIFRIPLSRRFVPDVMVWLYNKNGRYSVHSGYHTARKLWSLIRMARGPICGSAATFGREFGSFISPPRLRYLCGELATTFCHPLKSLGSGKLLRRICVPYATESSKQYFMLCGSVRQLKTCRLAILTVYCKKGYLSKYLCFV